MDAIVEALKPFIFFVAVLWGIETIVTMLIKDHKQAKRKQARENLISTQYELPFITNLIKRLTL